MGRRTGIGRGSGRGKGKGRRARHQDGRRARRRRWRSEEGPAGPWCVSCRPLSNVVRCFLQGHIAVSVLFFTRLSRILHPSLRLPTLSLSLSPPSFAHTPYPTLACIRSSRPDIHVTSLLHFHVQNAARARAAARLRSLCPSPVPRIPSPLSARRLLAPYSPLLPDHPLSLPLPPSARNWTFVLCVLVPPLVPRPIVLLSRPQFCTATPCVLVPTGRSHFSSPNFCAIPPARGSLGPSLGSCCAMRGALGGAPGPGILRFSYASPPVVGLQFTHPASPATILFRMVWPVPVVGL